jgi:hypothetical protein
MNGNDNVIDTVRAALLPHGLFLRGIVHFEGDGPELASGGSAATVVLVGNVGSSMWPAFEAWRKQDGTDIRDPLDTWSKSVICPIAEGSGGTAYFPSDTPWQPFQSWATRAEGLKASPLGILIHPEYGLWHGYRGAIGYVDRLGTASSPSTAHPCDTCADTPCLRHCPVDAVAPRSFDVAACRSHLRAPSGRAGCMVSGCLARAACPVGADHRYGPAQLQFHMNALG